MSKYVRLPQFIGERRHVFLLPRSAKYADGLLKLLNHRTELGPDILDQIEELAAKIVVDAHSELGGCCVLCVGYDTAKDAIEIGVTHQSFKRRGLYETCERSWLNQETQ